MQGKKKFAPRLFVNFNIADFIPADNFYRILKDKLDLGFIYQLTQDCYSHTGKPSLDPVVFFKILLIGYLENICSDRALERMVDMRIDLKYFIDYDIDERAPDHSTICKTLPYKGTGRSGGYLKHRYLSSKRDCDSCPFRRGCLDKRGIKKIEHTIYREEYMDMINRLKTPKGKKKYAERMCSVEPVFGSMQQHYGLRWMNVRGKTNARKVMLMCAAAFNLKKWLRHALETSFTHLGHFLSPPVARTHFRKNYLLKYACFGYTRTEVVWEN